VLEISHQSDLKPIDRSLLLVDGEELGKRLRGVFPSLFLNSLVKTNGYINSSFVKSFTEIMSLPAKLTISLLLDSDAFTTS